MRRLPLLGTAAAAAALFAALPAAAVTTASGGTAPATNPFGFTTKGLGVTGSYGEPSLAIAPDGQHVVTSTPGCGGVCYWYSADNGRTFHSTSTTSTNGGGDSELDFLPNGTLVSADLEITDSNVKVSKDFGAHWDSGRTVGIEQDRQWFAHTPDGKREFLVYHDFAAEGEFFAESDDGGQTWSPSKAAQPVTSADQLSLPGMATTPAKGGSASLADQGVNTFSGPMLVAPNGRDLYVVYSISNLESNLNPTVGVPPFGPTRGIVVAHSADGGSTWSTHYAAVTQPDPAATSKESIEGAIFPWGFLDPNGTVYVVYNSTDNSGADHFHQYYTFSKDHGSTWSKPVRLDTGLALSKGASIYATGAAVSKGVIDVAWYQTNNGVPSSDTSTWTPHFAQVAAADTAHPRIVGQQALTGIPNHKGGICLQGILCGVGPGSADRSLADFFELAVNPKTHLAEIAYADNNRLGGGKGEVVFAKQNRQPRI